jgi:Fe-Mn family superoxide dismutase
MASPFQLSPLPWDEDALAPTISAETIKYHYHKHHAAYVKTLNELTQGTRFADMQLEEVVRATANAKDGTGEKKIFNNAGQIWNHDFYWRSLTPKSHRPTGDLARAIERDFESLDKLIEGIASCGKEQFGSGWAWLVSKNGKLAIDKTANAIDPMAKGTNCLLTIDVWEHAYYIDYRNERPKYLEAVLGKLLNWDFAAQNLAQESHPVRAAA